MKACIMLSVVLVALMIGGCVPLPDVGEILSELSVTGSGNVITKEFDLSGFDQVEVSHAFDVEITQGDRFSVVVRVDENLEEHLRVQATGRTLEVGLAPSLSILGTPSREVEITMPSLTGLEASGASRVSVTGFKSTEALSVEVSGASSLRGDIEAGGVTVDVSGASDVELSGSGGDLVMDVSGAGTADLADFQVGDASIEASGASSATVNVSGRLDVEASGAAQVRYLGSPTLGRVNSSGGASIEAW